jgi:hypothetical protein
MPNWCTNTLEVHSTNVERLKEFKQAVLITNTENPDWDPQFTFDTLLPTPPELLEIEPAFNQSENFALIEKYGASDWYTWRLSNWGTKWDTSINGISVDDEQDLIVWFDTAWSPPVAWLEKIAPQFPELSFRMVYEEPGVNFCGFVEYENGECTGSEQGDYIYEDPETNREVTYNNETQKWHFTDTNEPASDDESYWPDGVNPYAE